MERDNFSRPWVRPGSKLSREALQEYVYFFLPSLIQFP